MLMQWKEMGKYWCCDDVLYNYGLKSSAHIINHWHGFPISQSVGASSNQNVYASLCAYTYQSSTYKEPLDVSCSDVVQK